MRRLTAPIAGLLMAGVMTLTPTVAHAHVPNVGDYTITPPPVTALKTDHTVTVVIQYHTHPVPPNVLMKVNGAFGVTLEDGRGVSLGSLDSLKQTYQPLGNGDYLYTARLLWNLDSTVNTGHAAVSNASGSFQEIYTDADGNVTTPWTTPVSASRHPFWIVRSLPSRPPSARAVPGHGKITFHWARSDAGGGVIDRYQARCGTVNRFVGGRTYVTTFKHLRSHKRYTCSTRAHNQAGWGTWTSVSVRTK